MNARIVPEFKRKGFVYPDMLIPFAQAAVS